MKKAFKGRGWGRTIGIFATGRVNILTVQGVKIGRYFSTGIGLVMDCYYELCEVFIPAFLNLRGYLPVSSRIAHYFSLDVGVGIGTTAGVSGVMYTPTVGLKARKFKVYIGNNVQRLSESDIGVDLNAFQLHVGVIF